MSKIEEIEQLKRDWKAKAEKATDHGTAVAEYYAYGVVRGLDLAHTLFHEPSNTQVHMDTKPCVNCNFYQTNVHFRFCPDCGRALIQ